MNDKFSGFTNVPSGVFWSLSVFVSWSKRNKWWVGSKDIKKRKGGGVDLAFAILSCDPSDRPGCDQGGENSIAITRRNGFKIKGHGETKNGYQLRAI
jgi:hypothetical protein